MQTSFPRGLLGSILGEREFVFKSLPGRPRLRHFRELKEVIKFTKGSHTSRVLPQERTAEDVGLHNSFPSEGLGAAGPFVLLKAKSTLAQQRHLVAETGTSQSISSPPAPRGLRGLGRRRQKEKWTRMWVP